MGSFGRKIAPELSDLSAFQYDIAKYEPLDMINLFHILEQNTSNTYIRIPHLHFPETIFSVEEMAIVDEQSLGSLEMLSLTGYGYAGNDATLITSGANFSTVLQLGDLLQEREIHVDIFVLSKLTIDMTEALKSSLHKTKKLIRITDQLPEILEPAIKKRLENF
jgi:transketolase C-terminal domain/subunit